MLYIVGAGLGDISLLTQQAKTVIEKADIVLSSGRIADNVASLNQNIKIFSVLEIVEFIKENYHNFKAIAVIATGDVCFYSIASTIKKHFQQNANIEISLINGIGSLQYFCAKIKIGYEDVKLLSLHGKSVDIVPQVCYNQKLFCLTGGENTVASIVKSLVEANLGEVNVWVGEKLSYPDEKITADSAKNLLGIEFHPLAVMYIENPTPADIHTHLKDEDFIRGKAPMTKAPVRAVSVDMLSISPDDIVYDIGAGTGSVTVLMAKKAYNKTVIAVEKNEESLDIIRQNIKKHKAYNIKLINALAPNLPENLPVADKVFIGGSSGNIGEIIKGFKEKNPLVNVVVNAVTLETLQKTIDSLKENNMEIEIVCLNASVSHKLGSYTAFKAENPVYIIKGC